MHVTVVNATPVALGRCLAWWEGAPSGVGACPPPPDASPVTFTADAWTSASVPAIPGAAAAAAAAGRLGFCLQLSAASAGAAPTSVFVPWSGAPVVGVSTNGAVGVHVTARGACVVVGDAVWVRGTWAPAARAASAAQGPLCPSLVRVSVTHAWRAGDAEGSAVDVSLPSSGGSFSVAAGGSAVRSAAWVPDVPLGSVSGGSGPGALLPTPLPAAAVGFAHAYGRVVVARGTAASALPNTLFVSIWPTVAAASDVVAAAASANKTNAVPSPPPQRASLVMAQWMAAPGVALPSSPSTPCLALGQGGAVLEGAPCGASAVEVLPLDASEAVHIWAGASGAGVPSATLAPPEVHAATGLRYSASFATFSAAGGGGSPAAWVAGWSGDALVLARVASPAAATAVGACMASSAGRTGGVAAADACLRDPSVGDGGGAVAVHGVQTPDPKPSPSSSGSVAAVAVTLLVVLVASVCLMLGVIAVRQRAPPAQQITDVGAEGSARST